VKYDRKYSSRKCMNFLYKCIQIYPIEHIHTLTRIFEYFNEIIRFNVNSYQFGRVSGGLNGSSAIIICICRVIRNYFKIEFRNVYCWISSRGKNHVKTSSLYPFYIWYKWFDEKFWIWYIYFFQELRYP